MNDRTDRCWPLAAGQTRKQRGQAERWSAAVNNCVFERMMQLEAILPPFVDEDVESNPDDV